MTNSYDNAGRRTVLSATIPPALAAHYIGTTSGTTSNVVTLVNGTEGKPDGATGRDMLRALARLSDISGRKGCVAVLAKSLEPRDLQNGDMAIRVTTRSESWLSNKKFVRGLADAYGVTPRLGAPYAEVWLDKIQRDLNRAREDLNTCRDLWGRGIVDESERLGVAIGNVAGHEFGHQLGLPDEIPGESRIYDMFMVDRNLMMRTNPAGLSSVMPQLP